MREENEITEVTRREIGDYLALAEVEWSGRLSESEFLGRLFDLANLPSTDHRFSNAAADIRQHRENWNDWDDAWVFSDSRFNLLYGPDEKFLGFLCETVHPVVRSDDDEVRSLVQQYNAALARDGWELFEKAKISGRPVYSARKAGTRFAVFPEPTGWEKVDRQLQEVKLRLDQAATEEQYQTVGLLCREVLITVGETVFNPDRHRATDGVAPSRTDAARMLEAYFVSELSGGVNEEARAHAKASLKLAVALQHKRTADFRMAALCAEATASVVNVAAIVGGRRA